LEVGLLCGDIMGLLLILWGYYRADSEVEVEVPDESADYTELSANKIGEKGAGCRVEGEGEG